MSIADEQQFAMDQLVETSDESKKKARISYTRTFLLSLSDKDNCKKLPNFPSEFNDLLLPDTEEPSTERPRISGNFPSHGFRRNDYSSSPPTRGIHGRWEGRSGGWNDKDSDSQSDRDPGDSGRRSGLPSRRPWQAPDHDGLLGKGSFPKPSGFGAGPSGPRAKFNDSYQLNRNNEPYQPPRPYKATPYTRRDTRDSFNDETFGSSDSTNEDRAEEERKRRASFELLRKEHQKTFQERQKSNPDLRKNDFDFTDLLVDSIDEKEHRSKNDEANNTPTVPGSNNSSLPIQVNAPRPLVPPGFAGPILEKKQGEKPQTEISQHERSPLNSRGIKLGSSEMLVEGEDVHVSSTTAEAQGYPGKIEQPKVTQDEKKSLEISDGPSILDKLFNTAINLNTGSSSNITQKNVEKVEERQSPHIAKSSKFAHLFLEEDNNPVKDLPSSEPPRGLLSLLQGADKGEHSMDFPFQSPTTKISNSSASKPVTAVPPVLTCEDLEQSILLEAGESYHPPPPPLDQDLSVTKQRKTSVDNQASQHLLSLLQRSADPKTQDLVTESRPPPSGEADPRKSLTLENLFGSAFMSELQSIGEPVSGGPMVSDAPGVPLRSDRSIGELNQTFNISALNSGPRNERPTMGGQDGQFFHRHQQYPTNPNGSGPGFHPFDSRHAHVKPQIDFMGQGSITAQHHDPPPNQRFPPANMIHRPPFHHSTNSGLPEFDRVPPHMMHMQDNMQHHHLMQGFPGGVPPHHNQMAGLIPELNQAQGFPFGHRQPNYNMPPPGSQVNKGGDNAASLQALLGIQQKMSRGGDPNRQDSMGNDHDLGFRYR